MSGKSELKINSKFAVKYEKYRQKEELQRLKDRYGDQADDSESRSSDSESDDESEVELDPKLDRDFYRTLSLLKKKDPKIYQEDAKFYADEDPSASDAQPSTSKKAEKPMFLKDYERKVILERGGKYDDDDESDDEEAAKRRERAASPSYMQEQRELKASFQKFVQDSDEEAGEGEEEFKLLKRRIKTQEEKDKEEEDYVDWLKGAGNDGQEEVQDLKHLRDYWNDPELDDKERFLRDFVLNKGYMEKDEERIPSYEEVLQDDLDDSEEEGEAFLERQEDFEREYNFRFEEPDATKIKTYPRTIATSVRSKDERRKLKRDEVKERKTKEKEQKHEQLKMLKNLKGKEIMEKLQRLKQLTGNEQLAFSQMDLEGDFDPQQHDQLMQKFFGDQYYGEDEGEKPQFDEEELEEHWNWDTWTGEGEDKEHVEDQEYGGEEEEGGAYGSHQPDCEDPDFIMDADYDPSQPSTSKKQKRKEKKKLTKEDAPLMGKKRKKSHFAEVITQNKPVFDPQEKNFEQYLDEYYRLDYEDIIDDLPCRFRYRQVLANDFGLSTDEILGADEKELNRWCSLKKTCMFRSDKEEMSDLKNYIIKANNVNKKKEVLSSFYSEEDKDQAEGKNKVGKKRRDRIKNAEKEDKGLDEDSEAGPSQATSALDSAEGTVVQALRQAGEEAEEFLVPKKKMKLEEEKTVTAVNETAGAVVKETTEEAKPRTERPKWPKKKQRHSGGRLMPGPFRVRMGGREFSGQRLRAYGLNPKRLHFRQLGRQKRKEINKAEKQKSKK